MRSRTRSVKYTLSRSYKRMSARWMPAACAGRRASRASCRAMWMPGRARWMPGRVRWVPGRVNWCRDACASESFRAARAECRAARAVSLCTSCRCDGAQRREKRVVKIPSGGGSKRTMSIMEYNWQCDYNAINSKIDIMLQWTTIYNFFRWWHIAFLWLLSET